MSKKTDQSKAKGQPGAEAPPAKPSTPPPPPRLRQRWHEEVAPKIRENFGITNPMAQPRIDKIVITVGLGKSIEGTKINAAAKEQSLADLAQISGQKPVMTRAKKSVSNFKVRAGYENGVMVTMRGARMWEFLDRLISLAIPRIKDFRGLKDTSFDQGGSYTFGTAEQGIFPEINMAEAKFMHGMNISIVFANSDATKSRFALAELGMPFVKKDEPAGAVA